LVLSLGEIARRFGGEVHGDPDCIVSAVASLERAGGRDIAFLGNVQFRDHLAATRAAAVILEARFLEDCPVNALVTDNPYLVFARVAQSLHPAPRPQAGIDATARIGRDCTIGDHVSIGPYVVMGEGVRIGDRVAIGPGCVIEDGVVIGADGTLEANVVIHRGTRIGARALIHSGAVIGDDGFGFANDRGTWVKIPQLGGVLIGDDVEVGTNTTIDRGALGDTVIEDGVKLDNLVQIAHNVRVGAHTAIAGCTGVAGSTTIGKRCAIGGGVGISGHLEIADDVQLTGMTFVSQSITEKGAYSSGTPFEPTRTWRRNFLRMRQLEDMAKRLAELERQVSALLDERKNQ
jgi:UDP-3-O-[3-hydroxymyristoyl] glucosamine N-acyltransferase